MINIFETLLKDGTLKKRIKNFLKQDTKRVIVASNPSTNGQKEKRRQKVLV